MGTLALRNGESAVVACELLVDAAWQGVFEQRLLVAPTPAEPAAQQR